MDSINLTNEKKLFFISQKKKIRKIKPLHKKNIVLKSKKIKNKKPHNKENKADPNSPFAVLEKLL